MSNIEERNINDEIMHRVKWVYFTRYWVLPGAVEAIILGIIMFIGGFFVSFEAVFHNATVTWAAGSFFNYLTRAIVNTEFTVQVALLSSAITISYFAWLLYLTIIGARKIKLGRKEFLIRV